MPNPRPRHRSLHLVLAPLVAALLLACPAAAEITEYEVVSTIDGPGTATQRDVTLTCPPGKQLLSGGAHIISEIGPNLPVLQGSAPVQLGEPGGFGWRATANDDGIGSWSLRVQVICGQVDGWTLVSDSSVQSESTNKFVDTACPFGRVPLGGGARMIGDASGLRLLWSGLQPVAPELGPSNRWEALARDDDGAGVWRLLVDAICATVSDYEVVSESTEQREASRQVVVAECPAGKSVLGGGVHIDGVWDGVQLERSAFEPPNRWVATARDDGDGSWSITADVICPEPDGALAAIAVMAALRRRVPSR